MEILPSKGIQRPIKPSTSTCVCVCVCTCDCALLHKTRETGIRKAVCPSRVLSPGEHRCVNMQVQSNCQMLPQTYKMGYLSSVQAGQRIRENNPEIQDVFCLFSFCLMLLKLKRIEIEGKQQHCYFTKWIINLLNLRQLFIENVEYGDKKRTQLLRSLYIKERVG